MPGKQLDVENGDVVDADSEKRKYYRCPFCDAVRGTEEGIETHKRLKHSSEMGE